METLHKYQILEKIGVGGFGVVYKATDPFIKRFVAIKTCNSGDPETRDRFLREAEIAGNLHHRNIVTVYDFGFHDDVPYLVQEYLTGEDLDRKIKRREFLPLPAKILYLVQIARGLQYAHEKGVTHRDVKPSNIRILEDDTAKIMDFGIAKLAKEQQSLTQAGITLGTAAYLAPEQIKGEPSGPRTDIFSFGSLAYELIAFDRPFGGAEISAIFYRILNEEVAPLRGLAADCPAELERIVHKCLEKDPALRYASCEALVHDLEELSRRRLGTATTPMAAATAAAAKASAGVATPSTPGAPALVGAPAPAVAAPAAAAGVRGPARAARPASSRELETGRTRSLALGDLELDASRASDAAPSDVLNTISFGSRQRGGGSTWKIYVPVALAVIVLLGAFATWHMRTASGESIEPHAASPGISTNPATSAAPTPSANAESPASPLDTAASPAAPAASPPPVEPAPAAAVEPEPVPPGILIVAPAWDSSMTVRVGKKSWPLDRERRFELEPGTHRLRFAIQSAVYSEQKETSVRLGSGESRRLASPIERPGRLTVQPHLNTRQGFVRIDGAPAGSTPLRGRWLAPGTHRVEIAASAETGAAPLVTENVEVGSDQETFLTFDLDGKIERRVSTRPSLPN